MGMRRNIAMQYADNNIIYLYTHWGAENMHMVLAKSLQRGRSRWNDESYLARIIASDQLVENGIESETGAGLSPYEIDPEFKTIEVNLKEQTVNGVPYDTFIQAPQMFNI